MHEEIKRDQRKEKKFKRPKKDWSARPYTSREGKRDWWEVVRYGWLFLETLPIGWMFH